MFISPPDKGDLGGWVALTPNLCERGIPAPIRLMFCL